VFKPVGYCDLAQESLDKNNFKWHPLPFIADLYFEPEFLKEYLYRLLKGEEISFSSNQKRYYG
jgi:hypothetical protein